MNTTDTAQATTTTIAARNLKAGMIANQGLWGKGEPTAIREVQAWRGALGGEYVTITFDDVEETNTTYDVGADHGFVVQAVELEMWFTYPNGEPGDAYTMRFPAGARTRYSMLRRLASLVLDVPQRFIRINSTQGVAWDTRNVNNVAYFVTDHLEAPTEDGGTYTRCGDDIPTPDDVVIGSAGQGYCRDCGEHSTSAECSAAHAAYDFDSDTWR